MFIIKTSILSGYLQTVRAYPTPSDSDCRNKCREDLVPRAYFILASDRMHGRYLLSESYILNKSSSLVGWVDKSSGYVWESAYGLRPREGLKYEAGHKKAGQERAICLYSSIKEAKSEKNCQPLLGGERWYNYADRVPVLGRTGKYYHIIIPFVPIDDEAPQLLAPSDATVFEGVVEDNDDVAIDVWLKSDDLQRWISLLNMMGDVHPRRGQEQRKAFVEALVDALQNVIGKPLYFNTTETMRDYLSRVGLPVRDNSPLLKYSLDSLMDPNKVPDCEIVRLVDWIRNAKQILAIVNKGDRRPVFTQKPYPGECPGGKDIPSIVGAIGQKPFSEDSMSYSHPFKKVRVFWVPKEFLP